MIVFTYIFFAHRFNKETNQYGDQISYTGTCQSVGMLALGAHALERALAANQTSISDKDRRVELDRIAHYWTLAEGLLDTCHHYCDKDDLEGFPSQTRVWYFEDIWIK